MNRKLINKKRFRLFIFIKPIILLILLVFLIYFIYDIYRDSNFKKKTIFLIENFSYNYEYLFTNLNINDLEYVDIEQIEKLFSKYKNKSIFLVPTKEISNYFHNNSWINSFKINNDYRNTINIFIEESSPVG